MQKFWFHTKLNAMYYIVPLMFAALISISSLGIYASGMTTAQVQAKAWFALQAFAQAMTKTDPLDKSNELVKMEGRRRKNGWKDTSEEMPWNHRFMEEGTDIPFRWSKYKVIPPRHAQKPHHGSRVLKDIYVKMEISLILMVVFTALFTYYVFGAFIDNFDAEITKYLQLIGKLP